MDGCAGGFGWPAAQAKAICAGLGCCRSLAGEAWLDSGGPGGGALGQLLAYLGGGHVGAVSSGAEAGNGCEHGVLPEVASLTHLQNSVLGRHARNVSNLWLPWLVFVIRERGTAQRTTWSSAQIASSAGGTS